jgi:hypothetical protein
MLSLSLTTQTALCWTKKCDEVFRLIGNVSQELKYGDIVIKQAFYKAQIRVHEEEEETGSIIGPLKAKGLWVAAGHDEWGIQNGPATGLLMSELILEGKYRSTDIKDLDPSHYIRSSN